MLCSLSITIPLPNDDEDDDAHDADGDADEHVTDDPVERTAEACRARSERGSVR